MSEIGSALLLLTFVSLIALLLYGAIVFITGLVCISAREAYIGGEKFLSLAMVTSLLLSFLVTFDILIDIGGWCSRVLDLTIPIVINHFM